MVKRDEEARRRGNGNRRRPRRLLKRIEDLGNKNAMTMVRMKKCQQETAKHGNNELGRNKNPFYPMPEQHKEQERKRNRRQLSVVKQRVLPSLFFQIHSTIFQLLWNQVLKIKNRNGSEFIDPFLNQENEEMYLVKTKSI